jgi:hypothetical protein
MDRIEEVKQIIRQHYTQGSRSWREYERAKQLIRSGFTPAEYSHLIKYIANYLKV